MKIKKVYVLLGHGTDKISLYLDMPTTFPIMGYSTYATIEAQHGYGVEWVRVNLQVEPEVINTISNTISK